MTNQPEATNGAAGPNGGPGGGDQEKAALEAVLRAVRTIEYGSVLIKIHQGKVVGIETSQKVRLDS
jgi:hypothetical protein